MKVTNIITQTLKSHGVKRVFELCGGTITHLLDSLYHESAIEVVSLHHEQAAGFAAGATGRVTGVPGVALATSGPGATNLLTAIGTCYFDSFPCIFITGQVNRSELKGEKAIRQLGFQECDIVSMARPITKAAWQIDSAEELPARLEEGFRIASEGRCGPVLLDIPMDVQRADITAPGVLAVKPVVKEPPAALVHDVADALLKADRPMILVGGGLHCARAVDVFRAFVEATRIPVIHSLMAVDALPFGHPQRVGMIGSYGNRWANLAMGQSDLLLVLGSRLDIRQTGADVDAFKKGREIFHVDVEDAEINSRITGCKEIAADLGAFLPAILKAVRDNEIPSRPEWIERINALQRQYPDTGELSGIPGINPNRFMHRLSSISEAAAFVIDVGQHQMWAAQSLELDADQRMITSGGMGAMGFALPAGIGVTYATGHPVVVIAGDGGFQVNIQELETVSRNRLPLKIVVINNRSLGMVRQFQQSYFDSRFQSTIWGYGTPDFAEVAESFGIGGRTLVEEGETAAALEWLWQDAESPALLQVMISQEANAYPKIAFGSPFTEMEP